MCRGTWRAEADTTQVRRPLRHCDHVLVPDDVSGAELTVDTGAPWVTRCAPITMVDDEKVLPAADARRALDLDPDGRYVLVQVGGGNVPDVSDLTGRVVELVRRHGDGLVPVVISSPVSRHDDLPPDAATVLSGVYPLAPYLRAFEFAVCRGGYNTVHENLAVALPAVYLPSEATTTDDQGARVDAVAAAGLGFAARTDGEIAAAVQQLCDAPTRGTVRAALQGAAVANGAREAGLAVLAVAERGRS
jgi:UDP:flavonoid glycosyltransferase YjiC (YdhE family)